VVLVVLPSGEEDRGQVERRISAACELAGAVFRETLDPLGSWANVEFWVLLVLVPRYLRSVVLARHGRRQRRDRTMSNKEGALVNPMSSSVR